MRTWKRHDWSTVSLVLAFSFPLIPASARSDSSKEKPQARSTAPAWSAKMRELERVLQEVLVDTSSERRFDSPEARRRVERNSKKLAELAHDLKSSKKGDAPDRDPSMEIFAGLFAEEASHAYRTLRQGQRNYARGVLRAMPGYCISCHTRNESGPQFQGTWDPPAEIKLDPLEKGNYYAATRKFDLALSEYERMISDARSASNASILWEKAVRSALAISVRVKQDPERAAVVLDRALAAPKVPYFLREQIGKWKESLAKWRSEPKRAPETLEGRYSEAVRLVAEARELQKYPADRSADVLYLRASAAVHDLLARGPEGKRMAEALFLAGLTYEVLQGLNFWDLHEFYYSACIRQAPHTEVSRMCFKHFQESAYLGYTGSAGTDLPLELELRLQELDRLSSPANSLHP